MRATVIHGAGDVRVETVPDPTIIEPTDALVRVAAACICGSDLWPYRSMPASKTGERIGHEFLGVVEEVGAEVEAFDAGDLVVAPFVWSDGTCDFCQEGLHTSCRHGGTWARDGVDGAQGEAVRVPQAAGTLVELPVGIDPALLASLLTLSDVLPTGYHCARTAGVNERTTVAVCRFRCFRTLSPEFSYTPVGGRVAADVQALVPVPPPLWIVELLPTRCR